MGELVTEARVEIRCNEHPGAGCQQWAIVSGRLVVPEAVEMGRAIRCEDIEANVDRCVRVIDSAGAVVQQWGRT
jgi:hypothetical protein